MNPKVPEAMIPELNSFQEESTIKYIDQILDTSSGYGSCDASSNNSDISSPDSASILESFDFTPPSSDFEHTHIIQDDLISVSDTLLTDLVGATLITSSDEYESEHDIEVHDVTDHGYNKVHSSFSSSNRFNDVKLEWNTEWDDSDDDDTSSIDGYDTVYTSQSEYYYSSSDYPNSSSEYDLRSEQDNDSDSEIYDFKSEHVDLPSPSHSSTQEEQVALNEFEVVEEGQNFNVTAETQENASVISEVSDEIQVSAVQANIVNESEISEPADYDTSVAMVDTETDLDNPDIGIVEAQTTSLDQEALLKKAEVLAISHDGVREARKVASNHIKHRMFMRDMLIAVAAGDENESDQEQNPSYSLWSSGAFGTAKQKASINSNGYSSKIAGGSIGADVNFENDLLVGASFSKIRSHIKHQSSRSKLDTYILGMY